MNKVFIIGNLSKDVDLQKTTNNVFIAKFSVAVKRDYGEEVDFLNVVVWRGLAESCGKFLKKGSKVAVIGSLQTRTYEKENQKHYVTEIMAESVEFLSKTEQPTQEEKQEPMEEIEDDETLPF